jgi:type II secretory pathway component GspD/PulD (secretin)
VFAYAAMACLARTGLAQDQGSVPEEKAAQENAAPQSAEAPLGPAGEAAAPVVGEGMEQLISLEFRGTDAGDVLKYLAQKANLNLSISSAVTGRVNLFVTNVPIRDIFDIVLRSNNLAYIKKGDLYHILTETEYKELYGEKFSDTRIVKTLRLQYAVPEMAFNMMDAIKSSLGRLLIDENSGTIMIMDTPEKVSEMESALKVLEQRSVVKVFDLNYAKADEVEAKLKDEFEVNKLGNIKADLRTNQLIVKTFPDRMNEVTKMIQAFDRVTREVLINAKIVKVTLSKDLDSGIDWNSVFSNIEFNGVDKVKDFRRTTDATTPGAEIPNVTPIEIAPKLGLDKNGPLGSDQFGELIFTTINRDGYELFRYLRTLGETKIISKPRLLVTEYQQASIHVGTREAYVTSTTTTGTSTSTTAEEVQFIDVGIKFTVTPRITSDGFIEMAIKPEVSSVVRQLATPSGNSIPIVDTSIAETKVLVKDGSTVIIGGLRKNEKQNDDDQVPGLARIPVLGSLFFTQKNDHQDMQELVIFITPHIVKGDHLVTGDETEMGGDWKGLQSYNFENEPDVVLPVTH